MKAMFDPPHPGEVLMESYLRPLGLTVTKAAKMLGVGRQALSALVSGRSDVSVAMAMKLARACNTSPDLWLAMQQQYDLWQARQRVDVHEVKRFPGIPPHSPAMA